MVILYFYDKYENSLTSVLNYADFVSLMSCSTGCSGFELMAILCDRYVIECQSPRIPRPDVKSGMREVFNMADLGMLYQIVLQEYQYVLETEI
jgi:hypothetical protein